MFEYKKQVTSCHKCPHLSNNAQEHDDPFTSNPSNIRWYCNQGGDYTRQTVDIKDPSQVPSVCPLDT